jgi:hypothetical protein
MFLGFEGTGKVKREDLRNYRGKEIPYPAPYKKEFCGSFVAKAIRRSNIAPCKYYPGPDVVGALDDDILNEAKKDFVDYKAKVGEAAINSSKICLIGYSRGAFLAMCFAKYLHINGYRVHFLGLFDAVSRDSSVEGIIRATEIPMNVDNCVHVFRSPKIGSRNVSMNSIGHKWEDGKDLNANEIYELPGSHAAMGGFPNESGVGDSPFPAQADPNNFSKFNSNKEVTAWWEAGNFISTAAIKLKVLRLPLVPDTKPKGYLANTADWYKPNAMPKMRAEPRRSPI